MVPFVLRLLTMLWSRGPVCQLRAVVRMARVLLFPVVLCNRSEAQQTKRVASQYLTITTLECQILRCDPPVPRTCST
jgi:hypothetical protein